MNKLWFGAASLLLIVLLTTTLIITAKQNYRLHDENERLILKADSLHMQNIKFQKNLKSNREVIDSLLNYTAGNE